MRFSVLLCAVAEVLLYLCVACAVVVRWCTGEAFALGDMSTSGMSDVQSPDMSSAKMSDVQSPDMSSAKMSDLQSSSKRERSTEERPRMIQTMELGPSDDPDAQSKDSVQRRGRELQKNFVIPSRWMRADARYITKHVLSKHKQLMSEGALFGDKEYELSNKDKCPNINSTESLMQPETSKCMYQCAETALLRLLPTMNRTKGNPLATK